MKYVFTFLTCLFFFSSSYSKNQLEEPKEGVVLTVDKDPQYQYEITVDKKMNLKKGEEIITSLHLNFLKRIVKDEGYIGYLFETPYKESVSQIIILDLRPMTPEERKNQFDVTNDIVVKYEYSKESGDSDSVILASLKSGDLDSLVELFSKKPMATPGVVTFTDINEGGMSVKLQLNHDITIHSSKYDQTFRFDIEYQGLEEDERGFKIYIYSYTIEGDTEESYLRIYDFNELKKNQRFEYFDQGEEYLLTMTQGGEEAIRIKLIQNEGIFNEEYVNQYSSN